MNPNVDRAKSSPVWMARILWLALGRGGTAHTRDNTTGLPTHGVGHLGRMTCVSAHDTSKWTAKPFHGQRLIHSVGQAHTQTKNSQTKKLVNCQGSLVSKVRPSQLANNSLRVCSGSQSAGPDHMVPR